MGGVFNPGGGGSGGDVTAAANITDNALVIGDGGAKGIQDLTDGLGASGEVLTSNGAAAEPTWQAAGGGFANWKTVGSSGDYADVQAMITAGFYTGVLITAVTEPASITPDANGLVLNLNGFVLTMAANQIIPAAACQIYIYGDGEDSEIDYTATVSSKYMIGLGTAGNVVLDNFTYDNNSSASFNTSICDPTFVQTVTRMTFQLPNKQLAGIKTLADGSMVSNCHFVGGGTACYDSLDLTGTVANNLQFSGIFPAGATLAALKLGSSLCTNVRSNVNMGILMNGVSSLSNVYADAVTIDIQCDGSSNQISNIANGNIDIDLNSSDNNLLSNIRTEGEVDLTNVGSLNNKLVNCFITDAMTVAGDTNAFSNCTFTGAHTISSGADNNTYDNCIFSSTISDTGLNTKMTNCRVAGTHTVAAGADFGQFTAMEWAGNVSVTSDTARYSGTLKAAITFTLNATATNNNVDVTIDQAVTDNGTTNVLAEIVY